jgi:AcrR family transcriptional regulator
MKPDKVTKKEILTAFRTQEILAAAKELMSQKGLETVTMDDIAQAAGVAKGTVYLYFPSKDELIEALLSQVGENLLSALEAILTSGRDPHEKLRQVLLMLLQNLEQEQVLFPVYLRESRRGRFQDPARSPDWRELEETILAKITSLFAEGIATGLFMAAEPRLLAYLLRGLVRASGYYHIIEKTRNLSQEVLPVLTQLLFSGIIRPSEISQEEAAT